MIHDFLRKKTATVKQMFSCPREWRLSAYNEGPNEAGMKPI